MSILDIILIAVGLAMDCLAVSIASSIAYSKERLSVGNILKLAFFFGLFQGVMPLFGWLLGITFEHQIAMVDHWIALIILALLGGKMLIGSLKPDEEGEKNSTSPFTSFKMLITFSIATSIDALTSGLIFVPYHGTIYYASAIIALFSFLLSIIGCSIGIYYGNKFKLNVEFIGGVILIGIGLKIFLEHMMF